MSDKSSVYRQLPITRRATLSRLGLGLKFLYVTIKPSEGCLGHLQHRKVPGSLIPEYDCSDRAFMYWQRRIITGFTGQLAEAKFLGKHPRHGHESDDRQAMDAAEYLTGSMKQLQRYLDFCWAAAEDMVEGSWEDIRTVAAALLERKRLSAKEVQGAILAAVPKFVPPIVSRGGIS